MSIYFWCVMLLFWWVMLHYLLLWQRRGMSFCWSGSQPDTETTHKIKYLIRKTTWSIDLKYQRVMRESTECSHCMWANNPHPGYFSLYNLLQNWKEELSFQFPKCFPNIPLCFKTIHHFPFPKCQTTRCTEKTHLGVRKMWVQNPGRPFTTSDFSQVSDVLLGFVSLHVKVCRVTVCFERDNRCKRSCTMSVE